MSVETPLKTLSDIVYWRDMKRSGIVFAVGIAAFSLLASWDGRRSGFW